MAHRDARRSSRPPAAAGVLLSAALLLALAAAQPAAAQSLCPPPPQLEDMLLDLTSTCTTFNLNQKDGFGACPAVGELVKLSAALTAGASCRASNLVAPPLKDTGGTILPVPLPDRRVPAGSSLPETLTAAVMDGEGGTYAFWSRHALNLLSWAPCRTLKLPDKLPRPAGFASVGTISLPASAPLPAGSRIPIAIAYRSRPLAVRARTCKAWAGSAGSLLGQSASTAASLCTGQQLVFVIRGALAANDWTAAFNYTKTSSAALEAAYGVGGLHSGFAATAEAVWPSVKALLDKEVVPLTNDARHPLFVGHSLGGATAKLLALRAQRYLAVECAKSSAWQKLTPSVPTVSALTFGAPNAGGSEFVAAFNAAVNGRTVAYAADMVSQIPCDPAQVACASSAVPTPQPDGSGLWSYERVGGQLLFRSSSMPSPQLAAAWATLDAVRAKDFCDGPKAYGHFIATHQCSYICRLSAYVNEADNQCSLGAPAPPGTSVCTF